MNRYQAFFILFQSGFWSIVGILEVDCSGSNCTHLPVWTGPIEPVLASILVVLFIGWFAWLWKKYIKRTH